MCVGSSFGHVSEQILQFNTFQVYLEGRDVAGSSSAPAFLQAVLHAMASRPLLVFHSSSCDAGELVITSAAGVLTD